MVRSRTRHAHSATLATPHTTPTLVGQGFDRRIDGYFLMQHRRRGFGTARSRYYICKRVRSLITHASTRYRATTAQSHAKWMRYRRRHKDTYPVPVVVFQNLQTPKPPWILLQGSSASRAEALGRPLTTSPNRSHAYVLLLLLDAGVTLG